MKHNNNLNPCLDARCHCGRYITLGEVHGGVRTIGYRCPTCQHNEFEIKYSKRNNYVN